MDGKKWECEHGCNQAAALKKTGRACKHLEALLSNSGGMFGSRYKRLASEATEATAESILIAHEDAEQLARALGESELPISEEDHFRAVLAVKGLSETKIAVLVARLVEGLTFQEIARELGYADAGTAGRAFRDAVDIFKRKHNEKK